MPIALRRGGRRRVRWMAPLSSVPERLRSRGRSLFRISFPGQTRAPSVGSLPGFALKRAPLAGYCRSPEFENRLTVEKQAVRRGFSTRSVLLPESLWVCPFGGVAA